MSNSGVDTLRTPSPPPRDIDPWTRRLAVAIYVFVALNVIGSVVVYLTARGFADAAARWLANSSEATGVDLAHASDNITVGAVLFIGGGIVAGLLTMTWLRRSVTSPWIDHDRIRYSPVWAVWGWLLIFINWVWPFRMVSDLSDAAAARAGQRAGRHKLLLRLWWGAWLLDMAIGSQSRRIADEAQRNAQNIDLHSPAAAATIGGLGLSATVTLAVLIVNAVAATLFVLVVRRVSNQLTAAAEATVRLTPASQPEVSAGQ